MSTRVVFEIGDLPSNVTPGKSGFRFEQLTNQCIEFAYSVNLFSRHKTHVTRPLQENPEEYPSYSERLLLCPGLSFAFGSMNVLALFTAVGASPNPVAINFTLPG